MDKEIIDFNQLKIETAKNKYSALFNTFKRILNLPDDIIAQCVSITISVCPNCYRDGIHCTCEQDD
jgi:hypothetical protein